MAETTINLDDMIDAPSADDNGNRSVKRNADNNTLDVIYGSTPKKPRTRNRGGNAQQLDKENQLPSNIPSLLDADFSDVKNDNVGHGDQRGHHEEPYVNQGNVRGNQGEQHYNQGNFRGNQEEPRVNRGNFHGHQGEQHAYQGNFQGHQGEQPAYQGNFNGQQGEQHAYQGNYHGNHAESRSYKGEQHANQGEYRGSQGNQAYHRANQGDQRGKYRGSRGPRGVGNGGGGGGVGGSGAAAGSGIGGGLGGRFNTNNFHGHTQRNDEFAVVSKLRNISGPTLQLEPILEEDETKFAGRNRLYVGNLSDIRDEEALRELFKPYGEIGDIFLSPDKKFAFVKVDYFANAEKAKRALDGNMVNGRQLRVRFSNNATVLRVSNLTHFVSNELLYRAFEIFGPVERAIITVDERGNHMGEGTVEFTKKSSANICLRMCQERCFFLTASLRPCVVEPKEITENVDGMPDKALPKNHQFNEERSFGPRFAEADSFDHEYGSKWKELHARYRSKLTEVKLALQVQEEELESQMKIAYYERETQRLRQELEQRERNKELLKMEYEMNQKQIMEYNQIRSEGLMRRPAEIIESEQPIRKIAPPRRFSVNERPFLQEMSNGFNRNNNEYGASNMGNPFMVFKEYSNNDEPILPAISNQIPTNAFDIQFENKLNNMIPNNGPDEDANNGLWGRRTL